MKVLFVTNLFHHIITILVYYFSCLVKIFQYRVVVFISIFKHLFIYLFVSLVVCFSMAMILISTCVLYFFLTILLYFTKNKVKIQDSLPTNYNE